MAPVHEVIETYFGHEVHDPYRYMEEGTSEGSEWIRRQADYSETVLAAVPERNRLRELLRELDQQLGARFQWVTPLPHNGYLYLKSSPSDDVYKLYIRRGLTGAERLLVDPERYRKPNGPPATLQAVYQSRDGRFVAYSVRVGNSERAKLHVLDSTTGRDIDKGDFFRLTLETAFRKNFTRQSADGDEYQLLFSPGNFAGVAPSLFSDEDYLPPRPHPRDYAKEIKTAWKKTSTGFSGDIAIPVSYFEGGKFRVGYEIGLSFGARKAFPPPPGKTEGEEAEGDHITFGSKADRLFPANFGNPSSYQRLVLTVRQ